MKLPVELRAVRLARDLRTQRGDVAHDARVAHERELGVDLLRVLVAQRALFGVGDIASRRENAREDCEGDSMTLELPLFFRRVFAED